MSVTVPPNIMGEEVNATVMLGRPVELHCQSDAIPPPTLSWRKDGRPLFRKPGLTVSADGSVLKVQLELETIKLLQNCLLIKTFIHLLFTFFTCFICLIVQCVIVLLSTSLMIFL